MYDHEFGVFVRDDPDAMLQEAPNGWEAVRWRGEYLAGPVEHNQTPAMSPEPNKENDTSHWSPTPECLALLTPEERVLLMDGTDFAGNLLPSEVASM